jgi:hypothetical protein
MFFFYLFIFACRLNKPALVVVFCDITCWKHCIKPFFQEFEKKLQIYEKREERFWQHPFFIIIILLFLSFRSSSKAINDESDTFIITNDGGDKSFLQTAVKRFSILSKPPPSF